MKFKTSELVTRIDALIEERKAKLEAANAAEEAKAAEVREQWLAERSEHFIIFANRIKEKLRKGRPILAKDIPSEIRGRYEGILTYAPYTPRKRDLGVSDLETLKRTLQAVTDEEITTTGLREIGFKNIASLFKAE